MTIKKKYDKSIGSTCGPLLGSPCVVPSLEAVKSSIWNIYLSAYLGIFVYALIQILFHSHESILIVLLYLTAYSCVSK